MVCDKLVYEENNQKQDYGNILSIKAWNKDYGKISQIKDGLFTKDYL